MDNDILIKLIYKEENAKAVEEATAHLLQMSAAERDAAIQADKLAQENKKLAESAEKSGSGFSKLQANIVTFQSALAIADRGLQKVAGMLDDTVGKYERYSRQVQLLSQNLGLSSEETSRLIQVSDDYGISIDAVSSALQMMVRRGTAPSIEALAQIADQYVAISDPIERAALMTELLGRSWTTLTPLLQDGGDAIRANADAIAKDLIITKDDIKATEDLRKAKDALNDRLEGLSLRMGRVLAPAVNKVVSSFESWVEVMTPATTTEGILRQAVILSASVFGEQARQTQIATQALSDYLAQMPAATKAANDFAASIGFTPALNIVSNAALRIQKGDVGSKSDTRPWARGADAKTQAEQRAAAEEQRWADIQDNIKNTADYEKKIAGLSQNYQDANLKRVKEIGDLNAEVDNRRKEAAQSLAADLANMDTGYYADRLKAAESYGLESARAEQDHQRDMRKLAQSHDQRMSKLADSRDALGLQDEMSSYEQERKAAEDDYSLAQSRRAEDYANQLRDMERSHQEQRQKRIDNYNQQLTDIAAYNIAQRKLISQQMADVAAAVLKAFTDAARTYTATTTTNTNTTNTANVNQTINGQSMTAEEYKALTYSAMSSVFSASAR